MGTHSPMWLSIARNAYAPNSNTPAISQGTTRWTGTRCYGRTSQDIKGFRGFPAALVENIFLFASHESTYTRWALTRICRSWRRLALDLSQMWAGLYVSRHSTWYDLVAFSIKDYRSRFPHILVHIHLHEPSAVQLYDLVSFVPPAQWASLHLQLGFRDVDKQTIETIFTGMHFPNLTSLRIDETNPYMEDINLDFGDPYASLYDAIFLTATKLQSVYVNSDIKAVAPQYGLFGQAIKYLGGSPIFVAGALPPSPDASTYLHINRLSLDRWDPDMVKNLNLPNLERLKVDHCLHDDNWIRNSGNPSVILPSLLQVHLTTHSLPVLPQICAGGLEVLIVKKDYEKWDGCLPPNALGAFNLSTLILDVWSTASLDQIEIHMPVNLQHLLTFLHNAKGLRTLTLAVPNDNEWRTGFAGGMGARWGPGRHLAHCPHLEHLTLLMDWDCTEGEWVEEIRVIFNAREGTEMRSIICRWTGDARQAESGPAGNFGVFVGDYYSPEGEADLGPNHFEAKQVETMEGQANEGECTEDEDEQMVSADSDDCDEDEDDIFGSYDDIPFP